MILDVFQWVNRLKNKDFKNYLCKCKFSQKRVPELVLRFKKICSTSPPRGNQVDGLPRASSLANLGHSATKAGGRDGVRSTLLVAKVNAALSRCKYPSDQP